MNSSVSGKTGMGNQRKMVPLNLNKQSCLFSSRFRQKLNKLKNVNPENMTQCEKANEIDPFVEDFIHETFRNPRGKACCGQGKPTTILPQKIPKETRLSKKPKTNIDLLKECIPKPERSVPPAHLPLWNTLPLDHKLPSYETCDAIIYSRGDLGQPLRQNPIKDKFTLEDPENHEIVVPYNALHDPATKKYFGPQHVKQNLRRQGLVTDECEVVCSVKEFNIYRNYLKRLHNTGINYVINIMDQNESRMREQQNRINQDIERRSHLERKRKVLENKRQLRNQQFKSIEETLLKREVQNFYQEQNLINKIQNQSMKKSESEAKRKLIYQRVKCEEQLRREKLLIDTTTKEIQSEARRKHNACIESQVKRLKKLEKLNQRYENQKRQLKYDDIVDNTIRFHMIQKGELHMKKVEKHREKWPQIVAARKKNHDRIWANVRKYFYIWLNKTRKRRKHSKELGKQVNSHWNVMDITEQTVKYLKRKSGYAGFDDFILNLIKLKQQIMHEQAEEEAKKNREKTEMEDSSGSSDPLGNSETTTSEQPSSTK